MTDWRDDAACRGTDPELFFPTGTARATTTAYMSQVTEAKRICRRCPVSVQCLAWAVETGQGYGIWGGMTEDERRGDPVWQQRAADRGRCAVCCVDLGPARAASRRYCSQVCAARGARAAARERAYRRYPKSRLR